jgi:hypothetical protein
MVWCGWVCKNGQGGAIQSDVYLKYWPAQSPRLQGIGIYTSQNNFYKTTYYVIFGFVALLSSGNRWALKKLINFFGPSATQKMCRYQCLQGEVWVGMGLIVQGIPIPSLNTQLGNFSCDGKGAKLYTTGVSKCEPDAPAHLLAAVGNERSAVRSPNANRTRPQTVPVFRRSIAKNEKTKKTEHTPTTLVLLC